MRQESLISVVMPAFNAEKYLSDAIESILSQTYSNFEFIIVNDGSTDRTEEIILSYSDNRIKYLRNKENLGIVDTLNRGIELAKGDYIARMDADDISLPNRFEFQLKFMKENSAIDVCGTWIQKFGDGNEKVVEFPITMQNIKMELLFTSALAHPTVLAKKSFYDKYKYEKKYQKAEDYHLWISSIEDKQFCNIPIALLKYRKHVQQTTGNLGNAFLLKKEAQRRVLIKLFNKAPENYCLNNEKLKNDIKALNTLIRYNNQKNMFEKDILFKRSLDYLEKRRFSLKKECNLLRLLFSKFNTLVFNRVSMSFK